MNEYHCAKCGKGDIEFIKTKNFETMVRGTPFAVPEATIGICRGCGARFFDPAEIRRWEKLYEADLSKKLLGAAEIKNIREYLGLQINEFAQLLGTTRQSVYNWERDDRHSPQLKLVDLLLRLIKESSENGPVDVVQFLRTQAGLDSVQQVNRTRRRGIRYATARASKMSCRESWEFDQFFKMKSIPSALPRLRM